MSFFKEMLVKKVGEKAEDYVRDLLGIDGKDDDKKDEGLFDFLGGDDKKKEEDEDKGGLFSFGRDKKKEEDEEDNGGLFSFGRDKKKEEDKGGIFSNIFGRDDDDDAQKKSGFHGLFSDRPGGGAEADDGGNHGDIEAGSEESKGRSVEVSEGDLFQDLMDVADETSRKE